MKYTLDTILTSSERDEAIYDDPATYYFYYIVSTHYYSTEGTSG